MINKSEAEPVRLHWFKMVFETGCEEGENVNRRKYLLLFICLITMGLSTGCGSISVEEFPICTDSAAQGSPAVSGNIVVWRDMRDEGFESIYGYNLDIQTEFMICTIEETQRIHPTIANPDIDGNIVVWQDSRNNSNSQSDIYGARILRSSR